MIAALSDVVACLWAVTHGQDPRIVLLKRFHKRDQRRQDRP